MSRILIPPANSFARIAQTISRLEDGDTLIVPGAMEAAYARELLGRLRPEVLVFVEVKDER